MAYENLFTLTKLPSTVDGLKYIPSIGEKDEYDWIFMQNLYVPQEFSQGNKEVLKAHMIKTNPKAVLEVGVQRNPLPDSSTGVIFANKNEDCVYIGVDIESKNHLNDPEKHIYTIKCDSADYPKVHDVMDRAGVRSLDLIFLDGYHSIGQVLREWKYTEMLRIGGCILFHDTNFHNGPYCVFDAIDETKYDKIKYCQSNSDWGISAAIKIA
jgi:cephalosporin hydroxylase